MILCWVSVLQVSLELAVGQLIGGFKLGEVLSVLLHSVVGEVDIVVRQVVDIKGLRTCSNIPFFVPIGFESPVYACQKHVVPDVKFPVVVEKRPVYI